LFGACSLATTTYFVVIVGSIGIQKDYSKWAEGSLADMAETMAGPWLKYAVIGSAMIASLGTFNALLFPTSQQLKSLGGPDYLDIPILQWTHPRFNTPWVALGINGIVCGLAGSLSFMFLLQLNNILYGVLIIFICCSVVRLRYTEVGKNLKRPFKVAEDNLMVVLVVLWPIIICLYIIVDALLTDWRLGLVAMGLVGLLVILYLWCAWRRKRKQAVTEPIELHLPGDVDDNLEFDSEGLAEESRKQLLVKFKYDQDDDDL